MEEYTVPGTGGRDWQDRKVFGQVAVLRRVQRAGFNKLDNGGWAIGDWRVRFHQDKTTGISFYGVERCANVTGSGCGQTSYTYQPVWERLTTRRHGSIHSPKVYIQFPDNCSAMSFCEAQARAEETEKVARKTRFTV